MKSAGGNYLSSLIEVSVIMLMATGTVFVYSAGANVSVSYDLEHFYNFTTLKQLLFFPLAIGVMYAVSRINYKRFSLEVNPVGKSLTPYLVIFSILLLVLVLVPSIGVEKNGARRWLSVGAGGASISFQPSELAKWVMLIFVSAFLAKNTEGIKRFRRGFVPVCVVAAIVVGLIVTQDLGTAGLICGLTFLMLVIGGANWKHLLTPIPVLGVVFYFAIATSPYRMSRLKAFFDPMADSNASYQARQSLMAISSGGTWGKGLGNGVLKYGHLPEDTTDFIFSIIAEELGFAGAIAVILVFAVLISIGLIAACRCEDRFGRLLGCGIVLAIGVQAAINIGVVTVVLPTKGIPLPFISAGGTSMLLSAAAVGILLNIVQQTNGRCVASATVDSSD